jgi:hypothetical protein
VLSSSPEQAREALLAVEASGRTAMSELRHLLGLLAPAGGDEDMLAGPRPGGGWRVRARIPLEGLGVSARPGGPADGGEPAAPVRPEFLASPR